MRRPEIDNVFIRKKRIPLGTVYPPFHYYNDTTGTYDVPQSDIVYVQLKQGEQFVCLNLGQPGCGKSILNKRIEYYMHKIGYKSAIFDYKGYEWIFGSLFTSPINVFPFEKPEILPIVSLIPAHKRKKFGNEIDKYYRTVAYSINDISSVHELISLRFTPSAAISLMNILSKNQFKNIKELIYAVERTKMHGAAKESILKRLAYYDELDFFSNDQEKPTLQKYWDAGLVPNYSMFASYKDELSFLFGKLIDEEYNRHKGFPKFILIDDGHPFISKDMKPYDYMSVKAIQESIYQLGRHKNWNMLLATQQPEYIKDDIIEGATHIIVSRMGNVGDAIRKKINEPEIEREIKSLTYDKANYIKEKLILEDDGITYRKFHSWGPLLGHCISGQHNKYKIF